MYWPRDLHLLRVPVEIPPQYTLVGILPSFTDEPLSLIHIYMKYLMREQKRCCW